MRCGDYDKHETCEEPLAKRKPDAFLVALQRLVLFPTLRNYFQTLKKPKTTWPTQIVACAKGADSTKCFVWANTTNKK